MTVTRRRVLSPPREVPLAHPRTRCSRKFTRPTKEVRSLRPASQLKECIMELIVASYFAALALTLGHLLLLLRERE